MTTDLAQLNDELAEAMRSTDLDDQRLPRASEILLDHNAAVRAVLREAESDGPLAAAIAERSYWHANGFAKLVLHRNIEPRFQLRLHVWGSSLNPANDLSDENIHGHRWEFYSMPLCGRLVSEEYIELADPEFGEYDKFEYESPTGALAGKLRAVGRCGLRDGDLTKYEPGDLFYCALDTVHRVRPLGAGITATLFLQGPTQPVQAPVYQRVGQHVVQDTGNAISPDDVRELAAAIGDAMDLRGR